jgi:hypothetical protein
MTSQINPNNIDGNYPVPGVPNNTQGFRSNFTETKTNFQYAAQEITSLQNSSVFKAALPGTTLDNNMNDNLLYAVKLQDVSFTYLPVAATAGNITVDYAAAPFQLITPTANVSIAFTNWPTAGSVGSVRVGFNITNPAFTVTLPPAVNVGLLGIQGISPGIAGESNTITFARVGQFAFEFASSDGGQNIWLFDQSRSTDVFTSQVNIISEIESTTTASGSLVVEGGVGIGGNLYVGGNIVGNITVTGISLTGNVTGGNVIATGLVTAAGNVTGGNIRTGGVVSATGNIIGGNISGGQLSLSGNVISVLNVTGNINGGNIKSPSIVSAAGNVTGGNIITNGALVTSGSTINTNIVTTGNITVGGAGGVVSTGVGKIGYSTGGVVTQATDKSTGVTLNTVTGEITMNAATLSGDATVTFTMTNSTVANTDVMILNQVGGGNIGFYSFNAVCNSGSANIAVHNMTNNNRGDAIVIRYAVIKGAIA